MQSISTFPKVTRDNQRQRVYNWERSEGWYDGTKNMEKSECIKIIRSAWEAFAGDRTVPPLPIIFKDWRNRSCYQWRDGTHKIIINKRDNRAEACLHEVAHGLITSFIGRPFEPHGPYFMSLYITLLATYCGYDGAALRQRAMRHGIRIARNIGYEMRAVA